MDTNSPPPHPSDGATYQDVLTRLGAVSSRMSDILRTLGIGTVVFCWGLFTADKGLAQDVAAHHRFWIVITAAVAVLGLLFDLLQAVVAYWVANRLRDEMEQEDRAKAPYPYKSMLYRSQTFFFAGKAILMPVATGSIIVLLFVMVCSPRPSSPPTVPCSRPQCCGTPPVADQSVPPDGVTVQFSDKVETALIARLQREFPGAGNPSGSVSLKFSDQIEKDLAAYLEKEQNPVPAAGRATSLPWIILGTIALLVVLLLVVFRKNLEGCKGSSLAALTAVTAVIGTTMAALEKLPHLTGNWFYLALISPLVVAVLFDGLAIFWRSRDCAWQFLATSLSFGLLSWVVLWAYPIPAPASHATPTHETLSAPAKLSYVPTPLLKTVFFDRRSIESTEIARLRDEIRGKAKPGDLVLLLGSTECSRMTTGNTVLANRRAQAVANYLGKLENLKINIYK